MGDFIATLLLSFPVLLERSGENKAS